MEIRTVQDVEAALQRGVPPVQVADALHVAGVPEEAAGQALAAHLGSKAAAFVLHVSRYHAEPYVPLGPSGDVQPTVAIVHALFGGPDHPDVDALIHVLTAAHSERAIAGVLHRAFSSDYIDLLRRVRHVVGQAPPQIVADVRQRLIDAGWSAT